MNLSTATSHPKADVTRRASSDQAVKVIEGASRVTAAISPLGFESIAKFLLSRSGLSLTSENHYLVETRLSRVARIHNFQSIDALAAALIGKPAPGLERDVIEAMTTNETLFFRDGRPFDVLRRLVLPQLAERHLPAIRVYSAAASTGQEPYSIAMTCKEAAASLSATKIEILATDIDTAVLKKARAAVYSQFEVQRGVPAAMLIKYFSKVGGEWRINDDIQKLVSFREFNLLANVDVLGRFDVVFCRNVLIYFDRSTKAAVLEKLAHVMNPGAYLFLGAAESASGSCTSLVPVAGHPGVYQRQS